MDEQLDDLTSTIQVRLRGFKLNNSCNEEKNKPKTHTWNWYNNLLMTIQINIYLFTLGFVRKIKSREKAFVSW